MSHRIIHRGKDLTVTIDGKSCAGKYGQTVLEIARENNIYIPTMCYLTKLKPISSCRMCVVEVDGVDGMVLSCQEKAVDGANINTNSMELSKYRRNIMKLYDVNHPLQCGVCDKSGECDLQNKTLEFGIVNQEFSAVEQKRNIENWGFISYDPYLCIMCERCVHTCNEITGDEALSIFAGGYKSKIIRKDDRNCSECGECMAVCPVGALTNKFFKYNSNAWEGHKIPSTCAHCSSGCSLNYEVRNAGTLQIGKEKIVRVTNDFQVESLCGAGRFGYDFYNQYEQKDEARFAIAIEAFKKADTIKFDSFITNEEALILQKMKERFGFKLINNEARNYQSFLNSYSYVTSNSLYSASLDDVKAADFILCIGTKIANDNPMVKYHINMACKNNKADFVYAHPIGDDFLKTIVTQFVKYEAGSEEGVMALLAKSLCKDFDDELTSYFDEIDDGYISAESNVGEEEIEKIKKKLIRKHNKVIVVGADLYAHKRASNIAKLLGLLEVFGGFKVLIIPSCTNTLGVSKICQLDSNEGDFVVGYNQKGDFTIGSIDGVHLQMPALNQQEGTFTTLNKEVKALNVAIEFGGYCLNDIANEMRLTVHDIKFTIDYTDLLPTQSEYKSVSFDNLGAGYSLKCLKVEQNIELEEIDELDSYNGSVVYLCNQNNQFNYNTAKSNNLKNTSVLYGSESFAQAAKIKDGDEIVVDFGSIHNKKLFKIDRELKGTVGIYNIFDELLSGDSVSSGYRYQKVKISKVISL